MIGLIIIGDEILSGRRQDKHLTQAIQILAERGMNLSWANYVGDDPTRITQALQQARESGDLVFVFGGIGATPDDHTRACAGQAWGQALALHPQARTEILYRTQEMCESRGEPYDPESEDTLRRLQMGYFPQEAEIVPNPYNRIPGFAMARRVHFLPGFPVMAWPMMAWALDTWHADLHHQVTHIEKSIIVFGAMESRLTPTMVEIETAYPSVKVFSLPSVNDPELGPHIELGVKGPQAEVELAFEHLMKALTQFGAHTGTTMVR